MRVQDKPTIVVAAGGTGGHLFPAFSLAEEMKRRGFEVDLITDPRGENYQQNTPVRNIYPVPAATLKGKNPFAVAKTLMTLQRGRSKAKKILNEIEPRVVVGFGGYPSLPPLMAARSLKIPTVIHEQNAVMGRANRFLAKTVSAIALSFDKTKYIEGSMLPRVEVVGNPVRDIVREWGAKPYVAPEERGSLNILIFGGSQGARYFSETLPDALAHLSYTKKERLRIVQQCREEDLEKVEKIYQEAGIFANLATFFDNLPEVMANSHLVIGRSGASTVAELAVMGRPSVLVPLPHALDNDQLYNAKKLSDVGGAWLMEQDKLTPELLALGILKVMDDPGQLAEAARNAKKVGVPDAVVKFADVVEKLAAVG